jgi:signal peptidase I
MASKSKQRKAAKAAEATAESPSKKNESSAPPSNQPGVWRENFSSIVVTAILFLFFTTFTAQAFEIPSISMEDTLLVGDRPFADNVVFAPRTKWLGPLLPYSEIRRGDIIIFLHPKDPDRKHMVKRVIGLPGDRIKIVNRNVMVNGHLLVEGYKVHKMGNIMEYRDNFPAVYPMDMLVHSPQYRPWAEEELPNAIDKDGWLVVPPGKYFGMGDNRDWSLDSRYWGFIPRENILGRALVIYWSVGFKSEEIENDGPAMHIVHLLMALPFKTRWNRLFLTFPRPNG